MPDFQHVQLQDICEFINGFAFKSSDYVDPASETIEVFRMGYIDARNMGHMVDRVRCEFSDEDIEQMREFTRLDAVIKKNLEHLGFGE